MHEVIPDTASPILAGEHGTLMDHHRRALHARGLTDETIASAELYSEANARRLGSLLGHKEAFAKRIGCCLAIPFRDFDNRNGYVRVRPDNPRQQNGKLIKYESPKGQPNRLYIPAMVRNRLDDPGAEMLITEGELKALVGTQYGFRTLGLVGVYGWKKAGEATLIPELERIAWQGRNVFVVFDSDLETNDKVRSALKWLCHYLKQRGAT